MQSLTTLTLGHDCCDSIEKKLSGMRRDTLTCRGHPYMFKVYLLTSMRACCSICPEKKCSCLTSEELELCWDWCKIYLNPSSWIRMIKIITRLIETKLPTPLGTFLQNENMPGFKLILNRNRDSIFTMNQLVIYTACVIMQFLTLFL